MEQALWYLFVGTQGGRNRAAIVQAIDEQPSNPNQLAERLELDYNTVTYHLEKLEDYDVVECGQEGYGGLYFLTDQFEQHRDVFEEILEGI